MGYGLWPSVHIQQDSRMNIKLRGKALGILMIPIALSLILIPFSIFVGWNLMTLLLFWFVLTPILTITVPRLVEKKRSHLIESLVGILIFYGLMVFMIYDHFETDYFKVMIVSCVFNLLSVVIFSLMTRQKNTSSLASPFTPPQRHRSPEH
jgi:hypothetical protein